MSEQEIHVGECGGGTIAGEPNAAPPRPQRIVLTLVTGFALLILGLFLSLITGIFPISYAEILEVFFSSNPNPTFVEVVYHIRMPFALDMLLLGGCLAVSGTLLQLRTANRFASPTLTGLMPGAMVGLCVVLLLGMDMDSFGSMALCIAGAVFGGFIVFTLNKIRFIRGRSAGIHLFMIGFIIDVVLRSASGVIMLLGENQQEWAISQGGWGIREGSFTFWLAVLTILVAGSVFAFPKQLSPLYIPFAIVLTAVTVWACGTIGYIGLIVPYFMRCMIGNRPRLLILGSVFWGGGLLMLAKVISAKINEPVGFPVTPVLACIGIPFLIFIVWIEWKRSSLLESSRF
ncbi:ABC transporter permease [Paenibacillus sp. IHB B 3084]|uniref:iron chelate uptake ABC transporter family permease subunit n=1 Tax=Paenibacillus TaxID=44249 RepID=UPI00072118CE|nr:MULTISPECIES: iron chelate uptake ABC transporter family permease subunit [Paenibacillus]ALP36524.1 ABC transporter permease [Paenibacillus sp. IHB B 3084]